MSLNNRGKPKLQKLVKEFYEEPSPEKDEIVSNSKYNNIIQQYKDKDVDRFKSGGFRQFEHTEKNNFDEVYQSRVGEAIYGNIFKQDHIAVHPAYGNQQVVLPGQEHQVSRHSLSREGKNGFIRDKIAQEDGKKQLGKNNNMFRFSPIMEKNR